MTIAVTGRAATDRAPRYLKQLCSHLGAKLDVEYDESSGVVHYEQVVATLTATDDSLEYAITGEDERHVYRTMGIVAEHLEKFGAKDGLTCTWDDPEVEAAYRERARLSE